MTKYVDSDELVKVTHYFKRGKLKFCPIQINSMKKRRHQQIDLSD